MRHARSTPGARLDVALIGANCWRACASPSTSSRPTSTRRRAPDEQPAHTAVRLALAKASAVAARDSRRSRHRLRPGRRPRRPTASASPATMRARPRSCARCAAAPSSSRPRSRSSAAQRASPKPPWSRSRVRFRELGDAEIERYLRAETPYDCAGSAKIETLGIALVESVGADDPTSTRATRSAPSSGSTIQRSASSAPHPKPPPHRRPPNVIPLESQKVRRGTSSARAREDVPLRKKPLWKANSQTQGRRSPCASASAM